MGQFLLLPPNYYQFSFYLSGHVADLVEFLTLDPSLIWNAARDNSKIPIREENLASVPGTFVHHGLCIDLYSGYASLA